MPKIHVILVCYRSSSWLKRLLDSLKGQITPRELMLWVIDNDLMGPSSREICAQFENSNYIRCHRNENYGGGNNIGFQVALEDPECEFVLVANPDTWYETTAVRQLIAVARRNPEYGVVSGLQLQYDTNEWSTWASVHVARDACTVGNGLVDVSWVEGSSMLISRKCLEAVGGFDPVFEMYFEDNDFCRRAILAGFKIGIVREARYHHYSNASFTQSANPERVRRIDLSQAIFILTDPSTSWIRNNLRLVKWVSLRTSRWLAGQNCGFGFALLDILKAMVFRFRELHKSWLQRRLGNLKVESKSQLNLIAERIDAEEIRVG